MKELVGHTIRKIEVSQGQTYLRFDCGDAEATYEAEGECCSESWFADITGADALLGGTVQSVEEISMDGYNIEDGRGRQEEDKVYGYKFTTDKGYATIVFRNSSNGYYGGSMRLLTDKDLAGVYSKEDAFKPDAKWENITDDWSS